MIAPGKDGSWYRIGTESEWAKTDLVTVVGILPPVVQVLPAAAMTWRLTALGAALVFLARRPRQRLLDALLGFPAGAMIFVLVEELVPESQQGGHTDLVTMALLVGFAAMMTLDVALG